MNPILLTDSYKVSHWKQYPPGTTNVYSYLESRGGKWAETVFFGLQYFLAEYLSRRVEERHVYEAEGLFKDHFGQPLFNRKGWDHIVKDHRGRLPLKIKSVPEGTVVPTHNVLMTVENTCPQCFWLTNWVETLLVQLWYPITVATQSREIKRIILQYLLKNGTPESVDFKLHDFGFRGVSSPESAGIGGVAHLVNFKGTDTVPPLVFARKYYAENMAGFSIPASEHSTIASWGRDNEVEAFRNMLQQYPEGLVACVSDTFDIFKACSELWGKTLKAEVIARKGTLVVRPDSGNPQEVVLEVLDRLGDAFGVTYNNKGYKLLHPNVRVIQGDGVNIDSIAEILRCMDQMDWSADNIAFGMGGALLQKLDRDTQRFAFKCSYIEGQEPYHTIEGGANLNPATWTRDVYKQPITDTVKTSKKGQLVLVERGGRLVTEQANAQNVHDDKLEVQFRDGEVTKLTSLTAIRQRAAL